MTWEQMERAIEFLTQQAAKHDAEISRVIEAVSKDAENIRALAHVVEIQHARITGEGF